MSDYLRDKTLSKEAQAVYDKGLKLWQAFYRADIERKIRNEYLLDKSGAGWYQIRNALKKPPRKLTSPTSKPPTPPSPPNSNRWCTNTAF